ncbi:class I SAM-dependent RNA methyltransferase [Bacteroidota bacterium]
MANFEILAKTFHGLEEVLAKELEELGASDISLRKRAVAFSGDKEMLYKANYHLRTALRILMPIHNFQADNEEGLYKGVKSFDWNKYIDEKKSIAIDSVVSSEYFRHSKYVALKTKDAIVDLIREKRGLRPTIDVKDPDVRINVHIYNDKITISLDSSGDPLFKRGYRASGGEAPLNEVLAAGIVLLSGWNKKSVFIDPMCGSGTLLAEAGMYAMGIAPGSIRRGFGFEKWKDFDEQLFENIRREALGDGTDNIEIIGSDISRESIRMATYNIRKAGLGKTVKLKARSFEDFYPPEDAGGGVVIMNPPYGERLNTDDLIELYSRIGDNLKEKFSGYDVWILSSNVDAIKNIGLHASKKITLYNGALECKLLRYNMYTGSKKDKI